MIKGTVGLLLRIHSLINREKEEAILSGTARKLAAIAYRMTLKLNESRRLGSGMYGVVCSGTLNSQPIAAKKCYRVDDVHQEARLLKLCEHTNVIKSHGVHIFHSEPYLIMELAEAGNLGKHLRGNVFSLFAKKLLVQQICHGLEHIHAQNVVHRDINARNLLMKNITDPHVVIGDFGEAQFFIEDKPRPNTHDIVEDAVYTFKSDVFLLARLVQDMFAMSDGSRNPMEESNATSTGKARRQRAIRDALHRDPTVRPTVAEFREAFSR